MRWRWLSQPTEVNQILGLGEPAFLDSRPAHISAQLCEPPSRGSGTAAAHRPLAQPAHTSRKLSPREATRSTDGQATRRADPESANQAAKATARTARTAWPKPRTAPQVAQRPAANSTTSSAAVSAPAAQPRTAPAPPSPSIHSALQARLLTPVSALSSRAAAPGAPGGAAPSSPRYR
eukprot:COSAG02_NODE_17666_length_988_cov_1.502812_1_plen_178_part_00